MGMNTHSCVYVDVYDMQLAGAYHSLGLLPRGRRICETSGFGAFVANGGLFQVMSRSQGNPQLPGT